MKFGNSLLVVALMATQVDAFAPRKLAFTRPGHVSLEASTMERLPESVVKVVITCPGAATKAAYDKACAEVSKTITIAGFRKGSRIPPQVLEQAMAGKGGRYALREQAINSLVAELIEPALKEEHGLEPIGMPSLEVPAAEMAKDFQPGQDLLLAVRCDVWPDIEWKTVEGQEKPYMGLKASYKRKPFDQVKFNKALSDLKERYATLEKIDDPDHALQMGDACVVNMEGWMADDAGGKGEKLPDAASGDRVEVILGDGRYMTGLVEGLVGAKIGDVKTVKVTFPSALKDKTLAGKDAVFDVTVLEASTRTLPEVTDEFANQVRSGLTAESLKAELQKAVDSEDAKQFTPARNAALSKALAEVIDVEVPDTLVTKQAKEKYAVMMTDMRNNGVSDEEIKKQISPENFLKYKKIVKESIIKDFKVSMAVDEIGRMESINVPDYQVDEQMQGIREQATKMGEEFNEADIRPRVEATLMREAVMDFLADKGQLDVQFEGDEDFDEELMAKLADEALAREEAAAAAAASSDVVVEAVAEAVQEEEAPSEVGEATVSAELEVEVVEQASEVVEQAPEVVEQTAEVVEQTAEVVEQASEVVEQAAEVVEQTAEVVEQAAEVVEQAAEVVEQAAEVVEQTAEVVSETVSEEESDTPPAPPVRDYSKMTLQEKAYYALLDAGALN